MPSLSTRANNEYINQDELAKRIAFERTISQSLNVEIGLPGGGRPNMTDEFVLIIGLEY